jgi:hypothetical protein
MLDLTKYSEQELEALRKAIYKEQEKRESKDFPYKVGDCFVSICKENYYICRIDALKPKSIDVTMLSVYNNHLNCFKTGYNYREFIEEWLVRIDPKIFDVYTDVTSTISDLKQQFINKIEEYANKENK